MNMDKKLSDIFDIKPAEIIPETFEVVETSNDDDADFEFARRNIKDLAEKGKIAVDNILEVARATDHPRAYEVAATLIKSVGDLNKDLMDLRKKRKLLMDNMSTSSPEINVNQAVFVGSTAELIKAIKRVE
jgi:hypothetical protein